MSPDTIAALASSTDVGDPGATRAVHLTVVGLVVLGVALVVVAVWLIRQTRVEPELLAPLEEMDTRRWRRTDPVGRRRLLDEVRPTGAVPQVPTPRRPDLDAEFGSAQRLVGLDDLADESVADPSAVVEVPVGDGGADSPTQRDHLLDSAPTDRDLQGDDGDAGVDRDGDDTGDLDRPDPVLDLDVDPVLDRPDPVLDLDVDPVLDRPDPVLDRPDPVLDLDTGGDADDVGDGDAGAADTDVREDSVADVDRDGDADAGAPDTGDAGSVGDGGDDGPRRRRPLIPGEGLLGPVGSAEDRSGGGG